MLSRWAAHAQPQIRATLAAAPAGGHGLALGDADGDGLEDLFVGQPAGLPNQLWLRGARGDACVREVAAEAGLDHLDAARAALFLDADRDGDLDLAVSLGADLVLLENDGAARFAPRAVLAGRAAASLAAADVDADGDLDLYVCGWARPSGAAGEASGALFQNDLAREDPEAGAGAWSFADVTASAGLGASREGASATFADHDGDGDPDLCLRDSWGSISLLRNEGGRFVESGEGGAAAPRGAFRASWADEALGSGSAPAEPEDAARAAAARCALEAPVAMATLRLEREDGEGGTLFGIRSAGAASGTGSPVLITVFAGSSARSGEALQVLERERARWEASGLARIALGVEPAGEREAARALLAEVGWTGSLGWAPFEARELLGALHGALLDTELDMPLPASFLVDGTGRLAALHLGPLDLAALERDLALAGSTAEQRRAAVAHAGRWHGARPEPDLALFEQAALARGLPLPAREFHVGQVGAQSAAQAEASYAEGRRRAEAGDGPGAIESFRRAVDADPYLFAGWRELASALQAAARWSEALAAHDRALALAPEHADTLFERACARAALAEGARARRDVARLAELDPERARELAARIEGIMAEHSREGASD